MPFNGSGTFTLTYTWATEAGSPPIAISKLDTQEQDIADGLSNCLTRDGQGKPTADIDWNAKKLTNLGSGTARSHALNLGQAQDGAFRVAGSVSGTNTITASLSPAITSYTAGMLVVFEPAGNNTGAATIALNGLSARTIVKWDGDALASGDLVAGVPAFLIDDGSQFYLLNPQSANLSNGVAMSDLARLSQANTFTNGTQTIQGDARISLWDTGADENEKAWGLNSSAGTFAIFTMSDAAVGTTNAIVITRNGTTVVSIDLQAPSVQANGSAIWTAGNDGSGSGLDADLLDGNHASAFAAASHTHTVSQISDSSSLAKVASNETISGSWTFSSRPKFSSAGGFLSHASSSNTGGSVTVSTSAASGTPANGDIWIQYS